MSSPFIIIPTHNEATNIVDLVFTIFEQHIPNLSIIVVDDNSPDRTAHFVKEMQQHHKDLYIIERRRKDGIGSAYIAGFKKALHLGATHIFEMDADFSHDPKDIKKLLEASKDADLVIGSRKIAGGKIVGWSSWRIFMSAGAMMFSRILLGLKTQDVTAGFRCFRTEALEKIDFATVQSNGYAFQEEMLYRTEKAGLRVVEVPVTFEDRKYGKSKLSRKDVLEFFSTIIRLKFRGK